MSGILRDVSPERISEAVETNLVEFYAYLCRSPFVECREERDVMWSSLGPPHPLCNTICHTRFTPEGIDRRIDETLQYFIERQLPTLWWTGPATRPADLGERLLAHGLEHAESVPGMAVRLHGLRSHVMPPDLIIKEVVDLRGLGDFVRVLAPTFELPDAVAEAFSKTLGSVGVGPDQPARHYVGWLDGRAVATSTLFLGKSVAGIYNVATVAEARGKGIGSALTYAALMQARESGYEVGVLQSTEMGYNVYRHLGFEEYCRLPLYLWK